MSEKLYETLALTREEFKDNLWETIGTILSILTKAGYVCEVYEEDCGVLIIKYNYQWDEFGTAKPEWLTPEERDWLWEKRHPEMKNTEDYE